MLNSLCVPIDDALQIAAFKPQAMDQFYRFVVDDWVDLYGVKAEDFGALTLKRGQNFWAFLKSVSDPIFRNMDGSWWDIFSPQEEQVRERLSRIDTVLVSEVERADGC